MAQPKREDIATIQTHRIEYLPIVNWEYDRKYDWPHRKFGYEDPSVLFGGLHEKFNTVQSAILDPESWHIDVCAVGAIATSRDEFHSLLQQRMNDRYEELRQMWDETRMHMASNPVAMENHPRDDLVWGNFLNISQHYSLDSLIKYFYAYVRDSARSTPEREHDLAGMQSSER